MNFRILAVAAAVAAAVAVPGAQAFWGRAKTETTKGNADMGLGEYKGLKQAIGCADFDNESGWHGEWKIGNNLATMLESALQDTGRFVLVERQKLGDVLREQDLAASGRTAPAKRVARSGLLRPARYIAAGAVTEVEDRQSGGGGGISFRGIRIGGSSQQAQVTVIVKLVDTTTGEIVAKERIVGKAGRTGLKVGLDVAGISTDLGGFKKTPLGQAAQDCINQAAAYIAKQMETFPFEGAVVKVAGDGRVIINRGSEFGVEAGQALAMATEGELLTDPDTGAVLGREEGKTIGKLKVTKVLEKMAYCDVTSGEKKPAPGTRVVAQ